MPNTHSKLSQNDDFFLLLFLHRKMANSTAFVHSRYQKKFYNQLDIVNRRARIGHIPRFALTDPDISAISKLLYSRSDAAYIVTTGLDCTTFDLLLSKFKVLFNTYTPHDKVTGRIRKLKIKVGKARLFTSKMCLACVLYHARSRGALLTVQLLFGQTKSTMSVWLRFGRKIVPYCNAT